MTAPSVVLAAATQRPRRSDVLAVAACVLVQIAVMTTFALLPRDTAGVSLDLAPIGFAEMFVHNGSVFLLWLAGGLTLGLVSLGLAGLSSAASGLSIGAAFERNGAETFTHLGHAVFELPALAIALWLSLRPLAWAARSLRSGTDHGGRDQPPLVGFLRGLAWWLPIAAVLLAGAAVWETATPFLPEPTP